MADLVQDLGHLEIPPEPELAGRAERAADRAAGLARDAQRVPLARASAGGVVHEHRFDERAVVESVQRLLGHAAVGQGDLGVGHGVEAERARQRLAQGGRKRAERRRCCHRAFQIPSAIWRARYAGCALGDPGGQFVGRQAADPRRPCEGHGVDGRGFRGHGFDATTALPTMPGCRPPEGLPRHPAAARRLDRGRRSVPSDVPRPVASTGPRRDPVRRPLRRRRRGSRAGLRSSRRTCRATGRRRGSAAPAPRRPRGSSRPSSRRSGRVKVAPAAGCGRGRGRPPATARAIAPGGRPPRCQRRSSSGAAPRRSSGTARPRRSAGIEPGSIRMSVTPVSASPARIAAGTGEAPR